MIDFNQDTTRYGKIVKWIEPKCFGFIKDASGVELFFHASRVIEDNKFSKPLMLYLEQYDYYVSYHVRKATNREDRKPEAYDIQIIAVDNRQNKQSRRLNFSAQQLTDLFGKDAAESEDVEPFTAYYIKTDFYYDMKNDNSLAIVVGHKGIGKTALFKMLMFDDQKEGRIPIAIKPEEIENYTDKDIEFQSKILQWKSGLYNIIVDKLIEFDEDDIDIPERQSISASIIVATSINREREEMRISGQDPISSAMFRKIMKLPELCNKKIVIYLDDLDREWKSTIERTESLCALLNALYDISNEYKSIRFRVSLRSNVYYSVRIANETSDKIDSCVQWMEWQQSEITNILVKRIWRYFFGNEIEIDGRFSKEFNQFVLGQVFDNEFQGNGKWCDVPFSQVLISLVRGRPRDMIKLCRMAGKKAHEHRHTLITTEDLSGVFQSYSNDRLRDAEQEFRSEVPEIFEVMLSLKPTVEDIEKKPNPFVLTKEQMLGKLNEYLRTHEVTQLGKRVDAYALATVLYKTGYVHGRKEHNGKYERISFQANEYITTRFANYDYDFEVAPAYRFALIPEKIKEYGKCFLGPELEGVKKYLNEQWKKEAHNGEVTT